MSNHGRTPPLSAQNEIVKLTYQWIGMTHGLDIAIPVGAAFNVIFTCTKDSPTPIKVAVISTLRHMIEKIEATMPPAAANDAKGVEP